MKNKWLLGLMILILIKGLIWLALTPIFQVPDEPSHFSYVQFLAENLRSPHPRREVRSSQELLAVAGVVNFDWQINHPVWRGHQAEWREKIASVDQEERKVFESNPYLTSLKRPGLYYYLAAGVYRLFSTGNFFWRFYAIRLFSLVIHLTTIWLVFLTAKKLFKNEWSALATSALVGFQPGLSFITSGVSYEPLAILAATIFFYLTASKTKTIWLIAAVIIGITIKPDLIFLLFLLPFLLPKKQKVFAWLGLILIFLGFTWLAPVVDAVIRGKYQWLDTWLYFLPLKDYAVFSRNLFNLIFSGKIFSLLADYGKQFISIHYHQIFPWYWGVFGWLEKTMPLRVYTVLKIAIVVSLIGLWRSWSKKWVWLVLAVLLQAGVVIANDFLTFASSGQLYGIQGRYFYPAIGPAMILFVLGLSRFISPKILLAAAVSLNLIGLFSLYQYFGWVW